MRACISACASLGEVLVRGHKERSRSRLGARGSDAQEKTIFVANDDEEKKILERLPSMERSTYTISAIFLVKADTS